jgi:hypothetical protein
MRIRVFSPNTRLVITLIGLKRPNAVEIWGRPGWHGQTGDNTAGFG